MCGIFSTLRNISIEDADKYFKLIRHRGPDASEIKVIDQIQDKNLIFGFHRLAIIDPTSRSMQPLTLNGLVLICNGEIFNYKELINKYNFTMKTQSDCEIILHLYEHYGRNESALKKLLNELRAEFAFILYDEDDKTLMAARDPFGIRPLFYSYGYNGISFASELKVLLFEETVKPLIPGSYIFREHNLQYNTTKFIKYYLIGNDSLREKSEEPLTKYKKNKSHLDWFFSSIAKTDITTIHKNIRALLTKSVKIRLMSDRPVGCFLSGGLDSSLVTSLVSEHINELHCFSIGLKDGLDITASIKVVEFLKSKGRNIKHHIINFTVEEGFQAIREVIWCLETRCVTTIRAGVVNYLLAKYVATNTEIKVIYSGSGSDEVFNGYQYGKMISDGKTLECDSRRLLNNLYLYDNLRDDRTTAAFGLEVRVPFLCRDLIDYVFSVDGEYRLSNIFMEKTLLRDAFKNEGVLPEEILYRRKEAWSDAVSSEEVSWYKTLSEKYIAFLISDEEFKNARVQYPYDTPKSKEALYYRKIFETFFPKRANIIPTIWLPPKKIVGRELTDPSATILNCYER